jgi:hypothetical protein
MRTTIALSAAAFMALAGVVQAEVITLRSGQVGGSPGSVGQLDDTVRYWANNPAGAAISPVPFTPSDFNSALTGAPAVVINPHPAWTPNLPSDPLARWINSAHDPITQNADGTAGGGFGTVGSCLFAVPFFVNTPGATGGFLSMVFAVDDIGGDNIYGGGNPSFLYINGVPTGFTGGNYSGETPHSQFIPFSQGWNTIYLYQRDVGVVVSGTIFSITIDVVPTPGAACLLGLGGLAAVRRRR